jgi:predicted ribonuclease YlaK
MALRKPLDGFVYTPLHDRQREVKQEWSAAARMIMHGEAGTGKTTAALGEALLDIIHGRARKIFLCKPNLTVDEEYGFLPGTLEEKYIPWMGAFEDCLDSVSHDTIESLKDIIQFVPIGMARGRTFKYGTLIVDEAQNCTYRQLILLGSRIGMGGRVVFCGDEEQTDLKPHQLCDGKVPLVVCADRIKHRPVNKIVKFLPEDQLRNKSVTDFLEDMRK